MPSEFKRDLSLQLEQNEELTGEKMEKKKGGGGVTPQF
jgi:hypothetical protein